jgi:hypothetical protein
MNTTANPQTDVFAHMMQQSSKVLSNQDKNKVIDGIPQHFVLQYNSAREDFFWDLLLDNNSNASQQPQPMWTCTDKVID